MEHILVMVGSAPYGTENAFAGLRCAVSLDSLGLIERVEVLLLSEGVYNALPGQPSEEALGMPSILDTLENLELLGVKVRAVREDLVAQGLDPAVLAPGVQLLEEAAIPGLLEACQGLLYF